MNSGGCRHEWYSTPTIDNALNVRWTDYATQRKGITVRERALKVLMVLVGLLFLAGLYPMVMYLWRPGSESPGDAMMLSLYVTLGVFLLLAARNPSANRSLIAYAGWANVAHATVMVLMTIHPGSDRSGLLAASAIFGPIGIALIALTPAKSSGAPQQSPHKLDQPEPRTV